MTTELPHSDESYLDHVYDTLIERLARGQEVSVDDFLSGNEHLEQELSALVRLACDVSVHRPTVWPRIPGFTLLSELGRGGMGTVYLARQERVDGRMVALKLAPAYAQHDQRTRMRFLREAAAMARIRHSNVVEIYDVIETPTLIAYAMEWIEGATLLELITETAPLTSGRRIDRNELAHWRRSEGRPDPSRHFVIQTTIAVAEALEAVHEQGLVHRDVKPSNILIDRNGVAHLADFGLARADDDPTMTREGTWVGTEAYAAPEQIRGECVDARADVYGLGATLLHGLTGLSPNRRNRAGESAPLDPWIPIDLQAVVQKAMQPDVEDRYLSIGELRDDLERLLAFRTVLASKPNALDRLRRFVRRNRLPITWITCSAIAVWLLSAISSLALSWARSRSSDEVGQARSLLVHPALTEALFIWSRGGGIEGAYPVTAKAAVPRYRSALAHYDRAEALNPFSAAIDEERDVVAMALRYWQTENHLDLETVPSWSLRNQGLLAYLIGDLATCMEAWRPLLRDPAGEPLIAALSGLAALQAGDPGIAFQRLNVACGAMPDSGELHVHLADAALQIGWLEQAREAIAAAKRLDARDPLEQLLVVEADLLTFEDRLGEAFERYNDVITRHTSQRARLHGGLLQLHRGDWRQGLQWLARSRWEGRLEQWVDFELAVIAERWWGGLGSRDRREVLDWAATVSVPYAKAFQNILEACQRVRHANYTAQPGSWRVPTFFVESWGIVNRTARPTSLEWRKPALAELWITLEVTRMRTSMKNSLNHSITKQLYETAYALDQANTTGAHSRLLLRLGARLATRVLPAFVLPIGFMTLSTVPGTAQTPIFRLPGEAAGDFFGVDCRGGGDIDADGIPDLIVGASGANDAGVVSVHEGDTGNLIRQHVGAPGDRLGTSVAILGDLNGDGRAEYLACATQVGTGPGEARVYDGATGMLALPVLTGLQNGDHFGNTCSALGDITQDGIPEFLVGALQRTNQLPGYAVVVDGSTGAMIGSPLTGNVQGDEFGTVAGIGDVDGDLVPDFIASGSQALNPGGGFARVYSGATRMILTTLNGPPNSNFGVSAAAAGFVDDDNVPDYIIGAWTAGGLNGTAGAAFVYSGSTHQELHRFDGRNNNDLYGLGIGGVDDFDGDGFDDLIIGADQINNGGTGYYEVRSGATGAVLLFARGEYAEDRFGYRNRPLGDVDGDGRTDWATAAVQGNGFATDSGYVDVVSSSCLPPVSYGAPKPNSLGCLPTIESTGMPSVSSPTPFTVEASKELNFRNGLMFYGFAPTDLPFLGGSLWVFPPLRRTAIQNAGGSPPPTADCSGTYSFDFNELAQSGLDPNLQAGTSIYCQYWGRDPLQVDGSGSSLTNGLQFTLCP